MTYSLSFVLFDLLMYKSVRQSFLFFIKSCSLPHTHYLFGTFYGMIVLLIEQLEEDL